jgi:hypothetical protein
VAVIQQAVVEGWKRAKYMKEDDLKLLREPDNFKQLIARAGEASA